MKGRPQIRTYNVRKLQSEENEGTLLDGGATHCLRKKASQQEWDQAHPVTVRLATGEVNLRQCPITTTLLVEAEAQPIVPVSKLTEVEYTMRWGKDQCKVERPKHGRIPFKMRQGCPTVDDQIGERMMKEIEDHERKRARVRAVMKCGVLAEDDHEKDVAALQAAFPEVPMRVLEKIPGEKNWDPLQVPRRKRRQVKKAKLLMVNMCSGGTASVGWKWKSMGWWSSTLTHSWGSTP